MADFWAALLGAIVGGFLSLLGVVLTLKHERKLAGQADERAIRDRAHDRLRAAYRDVVVAAESYARHAGILLILEADARRDGKTQPFFDKLNEQAPDISEAYGTLLLEADQERAILDQLEAITGDHLAFLAYLAKHIDDEGGLPADEVMKRIEQMDSKANALAERARERLAELQKPI